MRNHSHLPIGFSWVCLLLAMIVSMVPGGLGSVARADDAAAKPEVLHEFTYKPDANSTAKTINLAGDFNNWSTTATPMVKGEDGTYKVRLKLIPGKHLYKFVLDGTTWINDPAADKSLEEDDGQQGKNSAVVISADDKPAATGIEHTFTYHPPEGSWPKSVNIAGEFNNWSTDATPMTRDDDGTFTAKVKLPAGTCHYKFVIEGSKWVPDPAADKSLDQDDQHGGMNSGVVIK
jgi:1,4-alpha-glucan branching enzyme